MEISAEFESGRWVMLGVEPGGAAAIAPHSLKAVPRKPRVVLW
jgi:hypothetical protein